MTDWVPMRRTSPTRRPPSHRPSRTVRGATMKPSSRRSASWSGAAARVARCWPRCCSGPRGRSTTSRTTSRTRTRDSRCRRRSSLHAAPCCAPNYRRTLCAAGAALGALGGGAVPQGRRRPVDGRRRRISHADDEGIGQWRCLQRWG